MSTSQSSVPLELQRLILDNLYEEWYLCTEEVPPLDGVQTFTLRPSICYPTGPLLTNVAWRKYTIELLKAKFGGVLHVDMTNVSAQEILAWNPRRRMYNTASIPPPFVLTNSFEHLYDRITTLQIDFPDMLMAVIELIRPSLPKLDTIEVVERLDYYIFKADLSFSRHVDDVHDLVHTRICDDWFRQWMNYTTYANPWVAFNSADLCDLEVHLSKAFRIERLDNARMLVVYDMKVQPPKILEKRML